MELTVQNVYGLLLRSKLLPIDEARTMYARWQQEAKDAATNLAKFASWMVANKYLTEYQAQLLARGHADGFFLNEYKIIDRLGKGRMAGVYKAQHHLGQIVAIKVLPPSKAKETTLLGRFHREARLALRLKHPNIVRSFQTGNAAGLNYLVMEYLEGETLEDVIARRGKMPPGEAVRLVYQALQGLQHIHAQGLVHRDLKPSNLMLVGAAPDSTLRATLKILDIGLGRTLFEEGASEPGDPGLTTEGVLLGTPDYMSPEQARDPRNADIRADIYSLGCVLYQLLAGQPPFPDTNIISQMIRHATEAPRALKELNAAVPDGLQQIVNWMMAKDAAQRYPTPERAAQALQVFLAAGSESLAAPEADPRMRPYLTWLEVESGKQPVLAAAAHTVPAAKPPSGTLPAAKPPSGTLPAAARSPKLPPSAETPKSLERVPNGKRHKKKHRPPPVPAAENTRPVPASTGEKPVQIDVELVPFDPSAGAEKSARGLRLSRRDAIVFGIGAILGAVVTFVGAVIAHISRRE
ncbi:MAG TPA: protein kinase [Gemmataceae bacterium]|nr:protein kinase [Gemmataceae bacterium]